MSHRRWIAPVLVFGLCLGPIAAPHAADPASMAEAARCAELDSRAGRLACYDALFRPVPNAGEAASPASPLWRAAARQGQARREAESGLRVTADADRVLLTAPALGTPPPRPTLVLACHDEITHFEIHLPEPAGAGRVDLTLRLGAADRLQQTWRLRDGGRVLSGGRGLPAIETLRRLMAGGTLTLESNAGHGLDGLRFDLAGLRKALQPLRAQCRW